MFNFSSSHRIIYGPLVRVRLEAEGFHSLQHPIVKSSIVCIPVSGISSRKFEVRTMVYWKERKTTLMRQLC